MTDETSDDDSKGGLEEVAGVTQLDDSRCIWLGLELRIPDKNDAHDPQEMESDIREWMTTFLKEELYNIDSEVTGKGIIFIPRADNWDSNPLYVRYQSGTWYDIPDDEIGRRRCFGIWFPVRDIKEHYRLDALKENITFILGDEVYDKYAEELNVRGVLIAGSEESVRNHVTQLSPDVEFEEHI